MRKNSLFSRLLTSFVTVMLIPVTLFFLSYLSIGERNLKRSLSEQVSLAVDQDNTIVSSLIDDYRHKAYLLSTDSLTVDLLRKDSMDDEKDRNIYSLMFNTMKGDTYSASAHIVSTSGKVRLSTHTFPSVYDLRSHTNPDEWGSLLAQAGNASPTASVISIRGRSSNESGTPIIATILRQVYDTRGKTLGYVIVEVFADAVLASINKDSLLSEEALVDSSSFYAVSLLHSNVAGGFDKFPDLASLDKLTPGVHEQSHNLVAVKQITGTSLLLVGTIASSPYSTNMHQWGGVLFLILGIGILLSILLAWRFSHSIARPVQDLAHAMESVEKGDLKAKVSDSSILEIDQLDHSFNAMVGQITSLLDLTREEEAKLAEAERKALESQMNPHFLFNTLNTIKALAKIHHEDEIYTISLKLGKLLRSTVDNHESECSIRESMSLVESYLTIQKIRFGEKLHVVLDTQEEAMDAYTPKLIIQPMVENAIGHGLEPKAGDWNLSVKVTERQGMLAIVVEDDGIGFDRSLLPQELGDLDGSGHVGIYNAYRRIKLKYGEKASMTIESEVGKGTTVTMRMPAVHEEEESKRGKFPL